MPRWSTRRTDRPTLGGAVARVAEQLGRPLMPWQRHAADIGLEYELDDLGRVVPAYREVIVTVMRQSGKSTLTFSVVAHRCAAWPRLPQRAIYTAQDGKSARAKIFSDAVPMYEASPLFRKLISPPHGRVYRGVGPFEGVNWGTGSTIRMIGSSEDDGHGLTDTGLAVIDESFSDTDDRREQALSPGMATVFDAQTWNVSTAGTEASTFLRRKIDAGRHAVEVGRTSGLAYVEYSIPDDADCDDPETWWAYMPALGWTISEEVVAHNRASMSDNDWRRSFGNQWTSADQRAIPLEVWQAACGAHVPSGDITFAVEVHPDRERASIAACGTGVVELVDTRPDVLWVVDRCIELQRRHGGRIRIDGGGPAGALLQDLDRARVRVEVLSTRDVVQACGAFYDGLIDGRLKVRSDGRLDAAAAAVSKRKVGDAWAWSRRAPQTDVTPIMALSLAAPLPTETVSAYEERGLEVFG